MFLYRNARLIVSFIVVVFITSCDKYDLSEKQSELFVKYFPTKSSESYGNDVCQLQNGGYAILGNTLSSDGSDDQNDIMFILTDEFGNTTNLSSPIIESTGNAYGNSMIEVSDGFLIAGNNRSGNKVDGYLVKINADGQVIWEKTYSTYEEQGFNKIIQTGNDQFVLAGYCQDVLSDIDVYLVKVNSGGDSLWTKKFGRTDFHDVGNSVVEIQNRYVIVGSSIPKDNTGDYSKLLLYNTNLSGEDASEQIVPGDYHLNGKDIITNSAGSLLAVGNQNVPFSGKSEIYFCQITLEGINSEIITLGLSKIIDYPESLFGERMILSTQGNPVICGWRSRQNDTDIMYLSIGQDLNINTLNFWGTTGFQASYGITNTSDDGFALTGTVELGSNKVCMLMKLNTTGSFDK